MPELPEVESVRRLMERVLVGKKIVNVEVSPDEIILGGTPPETFRAALLGRTVQRVGRKGKYWWLEFDGKPFLFGHLGMSGWIRDLARQSLRLHSHGDAPLDDEAGRPRFLKLLIETADGARIAFTDPRRLGRLWLGDSPEQDSRIQKLGFDCLTELPSAAKIGGLLAKRKAPIKAVLLDQSLFAGIGNWIADEVLYQSGIAPKRLANSLSRTEVQKLRTAIETVLATAVKVDADSSKFPASWLFHHRWGGGRGAEWIDAEPILREKVGARTTAWAPTRQK